MDGKMEEKEEALTGNGGSLQVGYPEASEYLARFVWVAPLLRNNIFLLLNFVFWSKW